MIPAMRQQSIMNHLMKTDIASISSLAELLDVSHMTVRRDIQKLEQAGRVLSVSGGVSLARKEAPPTPRVDKWNQQSREKEAIARVAETLLNADTSVFLEAGTTTFALARQIALADHRYDKLLVVTNDLVIASFLTENTGCRVYFAGGMVERDTRSCVSETAVEALKSLNIDIAFIAPQSWDNHWLSVPNADKSLVKKSVVAASHRRVLLSDSSKYGRVSAFKAMPLSGFDTVVSDDGLPAKARDALKELGIELLLAEMDEE